LNLLENLNPEQLAAVTLPHTSALILAGAGSGKTRVLTTRIAWLLATGQASPLSILGVTFTNKAAKEMLTRLAALTPINIRGMWIGTFHGCATGCCACIIATRTCPSYSRSWTRRTSSH
jgi:DNA helicase-2/ATP-dependent DNA helicase PcrA